MPDEIKDQENSTAPSQSEWSGTPFQGWQDSENPGGEVQGEETQQEAVSTEEQEQTVEQSVDNPGDAEEQAELQDVEQVAAEESVELTAEADQPQADELMEQPAPVEQPAAEPTPPKESAGPPGQPVDYSRTFRALEEGDVVQGVVVHIDKEGVLVDVGTKSEGIVRPNELSRRANISPEDVVQVGDNIDVYVIQSEDQEGGLILSKKRADFERAWERVEDAHRTGKTLSAMVSDRVKGGLVVDLGIRGFVPASHVGSGKIKNLDRYVGQSIPLKVIEVDRERRKVVLSNRQAAEDEREKHRTETLKTLAEGQVRQGVVRRLTDYGAFIDLGGIDGLLHISEMSWTRIRHPSEVVKVGEKLQVMILRMNLDQGKISLGLRQILPDPWAEVEHKYHVGDVITGTVSRLVPFGAFVQVDGGIEGIIPNSELAVRRVSKPEDVVSVGQQVEVRVIDLRPEERRMTLSLRQLQQQKERERERSEMANYSYGRDEPRTTIGDLVGDMVREARAERRERKRRERRAEKQVEEEEEEVIAEPERVKMVEVEVEDQVEETEAVTVEDKVEEVAVEETTTEVATVEETVDEAVVEEAEAVVETPEETVEQVEEEQAEPAAEVEAETKATVQEPASEEAIEEPIESVEETPSAEAQEEIVQTEEQDEPTAEEENKEE